MARVMKPSEVLWIDETPISWSIRRVKDDFRVVGGGTPSEQEINADFVTRWATPADFSDAQRVLAQTARAISNKGHQEIGRTLINTNGLLVSCRAPAGKVALPSRPLSFNQGCKGLSPRHGAINRVWAFYALVDQRMQIEELARGATFAEISGEALKGVMLPSPLVGEQRRIAAWLDIQTGRIDKRLELLGKKRELLVELKQSRIDAAISCGFNSDRPMKDSGISWLGAIPGTWSVRTLKTIVSKKITDGPHETPVFLEAGIPFVSAEACSSGIINFDKIRGFISIEEHRRFSRKYFPKRNDVYLIKSGATTGKTAIVEVDTEFNIWSPLAAIRCNSHHSPLFLLNFLRSKKFQEEIARSWSFGTQQNIGMNVLEKMYMPCPPLEEQRQIANLLVAQCKPIDTQIALIDQLEQLIKQQRKAIIHDAVTGKIDLSTYVPPQPQEALAA